MKQSTFDFKQLVREINKIELAIENATDDSEAVVLYQHLAMVGQTIATAAQQAASIDRTKAVDALMDKAEQAYRKAHQPHLITSPKD